MFVLVVGLTGSPPTIRGHEAMIRVAMAKFLADGHVLSALKVVMLPSADGPPVLGKVSSASAHHRVAMVNIMASKLQQDFPSVVFQVSQLDILFGQLTGQPSYLVDTLRLLYNEADFFSREYPPFASELFLAPEDKLILLYGEDSLATLPTWKSSKEIERFLREKNIELWIMPRSGVAIDPEKNAFVSLCTWLPANHLVHQPSVSSTQIREAVVFLAENLQPEILRYIEKERLYTR